jgi:heme exporter protein B
VIRPLAAIVARDLRLAWRAGGNAGIAVIFFLTVVVIAAFGVGPDLKLLARIGSAVLWIGALLAVLLGLDRIFAMDQEDGSLDLLVLVPLPLPAIALAKALAHWLATGIPLVVATPVLGTMLGLDVWALGSTALTLLFGTAALTLLGLVGAALSAMLPRAGMLVAMLILPLAIPILIFGVAASEATLGGAPFGVPFRLLLALFLFFLVLGPVAAAAALRHARD